MTTKDTTMVDKDPITSSINDYSSLLQTPHSDAFAFSETEQRVLQLYDQLQELGLQEGLIEAQVKGNHESEISALSDDELRKQLIRAEREAMEARAKYEIRNRMTQNTLAVDPVCKAVYASQQRPSSHAEKRILSMIVENDAVSMLHSSLISKLASTTLALRAVEQDNITANKDNRELSKKLLERAEEAIEISAKDIDDSQLRDRVLSVQKDVDKSRRRMRTLKGILSGLIVGSGINWAADEDLRKLVMDDEEDG